MTTEAQPRKSIRWIEFMVVVSVLVTLFGILLPAIAQVRNAARRTQSLNQLRQLGLGAINYESGRMRFPKASMKIRSSHQCEHGWEIALVPNLESNNLASRIDYDQPWDSARNSHVFSQEFPLFLNPLEDGLFDEEGYGLNHYAANSAVILESGEAATLDSVHSNDVLFGEICDGYLPWGQPGNARPYTNGVRYDTTSFGNPKFAGAGVVFVDGSTHWIEASAARPKKRATAIFNHRPFELGGTSNLQGFSYYCDYSPTYNGGMVFFGVYTGRSKTCDYPEGDSISNGELYRLQRLANLKGVELGDESSVTEEGIKTLCELTELKHLSLGDVVIGSSTLQELQKLKQLQWLELVDENLSENDLEVFRQKLTNCIIQVR